MSQTMTRTRTSAAVITPVYLVEELVLNILKLSLEQSHRPHAFYGT